MKSRMEKAVAKVECFVKAGHSLTYAIGKVSADMGMDHRALLNYFRE